MQPNEIKKLIEAGLADSQVMVEGDGAHFQAIVISSVFTSKSRIQKQQLVYNTVKQHLLDGALHALSIKTFTPEEWETMPPANQNGNG